MLKKAGYDAVVYMPRHDGIIKNDTRKGCVNMPEKAEGIR